MTAAEVGFFVLRTPLLSFDDLARLGRHRSEARARLVEYMQRPELREALFVASPVLEGEVDLWLRDPTSERGQKIERSLVRYFCRMTGRATPFGLFSGCSTGTVGAETRLELETMARNRRHTRLDMYYVCELADAIARLPAIRDELRFYPSSSMYRIADQLYYVEATSAKGSRDYHLSVVERTPYLDATLARAETGASLSSLAEALVADEPDLEHAEARRYVDQLVDAQVLVSSLAPTVTGPESIAAVIAELDGSPAGHQLAAPLRSATSQLSELDARGLGRSPSSYRELAAELAELPVAVELPRLFQVDMVKSSPAATLGADVIREIGRAVDLLRRIGPATGDDSMLSFRAAFTARYDDREVPLVEVLDEENGIGFERAQGPWSEASPLLRGFSFGAAGGQAPFTTRDAHLARRLAEVWRTGAHELELTEADWRAIETRDPAPLPDSFAVMAQVAATSDATIDRGEFRVLVEHVSGPSAAILLGRFCHADPELHRHVRAMLRDEESVHPDAIYAEIVHLPEGRIGNIISRPVLRDYEIVYLGASGAPRDRQLTIGDLTIAVVDRRVVLRSRRLEREVIPRLSNAHNTALRSLGIYRFLCAVQRQHVMAGAGWHWGVHGSADYLPRVTAGRIVLSPQRWNWDRTLLAELDQPGGLDQLRARLRLPRWVAISEGDNQLPIDLDSELLVDTMRQIGKTRGGMQVVEVFPQPDEMCARSSEGRFVHELIVPFRAASPAAATRSTIVRIPDAPHIRVRPPGSDWIYAKLYVGPATADRVLRELVAPLIDELRSTTEPFSWFFIRFADPDWHLRLRVHGDPAWLHEFVLPRVETAATALLEAGIVWKLQLDTYVREVERYGGTDGLLLSEGVFHADSDAALAMLPLVVGDGGADRRWRLTLLGMDHLLSDLGLPLAAKLAVMREARAGFGREFGVDTSFERQLGDRFRRERAALDALFGAAVPDAPATAVLAARSARLEPLGVELRASHAAGRLAVTVEQLAASYLHMHANRMLRGAAREQELILYDFLQRLYESQQARARKRQPSSPDDK